MKNTPKTPRFSPIDTTVILVLLPMIAGSVAVSYEVGFFSGIGMNYFYVFSLSEHLTFALADLPMALGIALVTLFSITWAGQYPTITLSLPLAFIFACGTIIAYYRPFDNLAFPALLFVCIGGVGGLLASKKNVSPNHILFFVFVCVISVSLITGQAISAVLLGRAKSAYIIQMDNGEVRGLILRTGTNGVLIHELKASETRLIPWTRIRLISRRQTN
jgi:hypothetical protein